MKTVYSRVCINYQLNWLWKLIRNYFAINMYNCDLSKVPTRSCLPVIYAFILCIVQTQDDVVGVSRWRARSRGGALCRDVMRLAAAKGHCDKRAAVTSRPRPHHSRLHAGTAEPGERELNSQCDSQLQTVFVIIAKDSNIRHFNSIYLINIKTKCCICY